MVALVTWRMVRGRDLWVGQRYRQGNVVFTIVDIVSLPVLLDDDGTRVILAPVRQVVLSRKGLRSSSGFNVAEDARQYRVQYHLGVRVLDMAEVDRYRSENIA